MLSRKHPPELYDIVRVPCTPPDGRYGRISVNVAEDVYTALTAYMSKHQVPAEVATVHAIAALRAIDRQLIDGHKICWFKPGMFSTFRKCIELKCNFDTPPKQTQEQAANDQTYPRVDVHLPIDAFELARSHMAVREVSPTEAMRRAIAVLHNLDESLSDGWRLGVYRTGVEDLELTEMILDFTADQARVWMAYQPMRW